jgi:hypothetical protein
MAENSDQKSPEGDPQRGDAILKRMLKTPPKPFTKKKENPNRGRERPEYGFWPPLEVEI